MNEKKMLKNHIWIHSLRKSNMTAIGMVLAAMIVIAGIASPYFLDVYNLQSLIRDLAFIGMIGIAQSLLLLIGELDLSVGKIASLCGILAGMMMVQYGINPWMALGIALFFRTVFWAFKWNDHYQAASEFHGGDNRNAGRIWGHQSGSDKGEGYYGNSCRNLYFGKRKLGADSIPFRVLCDCAAPGVVYG